MATLGPFGTNNSYIFYTITATEVNVNTAENYSDVSVSVRIYRTNNYSTYGTGTLYLRFDGGIHTYGLTTSHKINTTGVTLDMGTLKVLHNPDGQYNLPISAWISHSQVSSSEQGGTVALTNIPRQASITNVTSTGLTGTYTYNWNSNTNAYYYRARISIPNVIKIKDINLGQQSGGKTNTFTFTSAELSTILNSVTSTTSQVTVGVVIETHTNSSYTSKLGESGEAMVAVTVPTTITASVPTGRDNNSTIVNLTGNANYLVQNKSNLLVTVTSASVADCATTTNQTTIAKYEVTVNGQTKTLTSAGTLDFGRVTSGSNLSGTLKVTDSRKNTRTVSFTVNVIPYLTPSVAITSCYRCNSDGTENATTGSYAFVNVTYSICSIKILGVEKNALKSRSLKIDGVSKSTTFVSGTGGVYGTITSAEHTINVDVTDLFNSTNESVYTLRSALSPLVIKENKMAVGIGGMPTKDSQFYIGFDEFNIKGNVQPVFNVSGNIVSLVNTSQLIANSDVQGFTHSTSEKWTNDYWIDGKRIYCKTISMGALNSATVSKAHGISNFNALLWATGFAYSASAGVWISLPRAHLDNNYDGISIEASATNVLLRVGPSNIFSSSYVTIYYTKTTG